MIALDQEDLAWLKPDLWIGDQYLVREALDKQASGNWATVMQALKQPDGRPVVLKIMRARHGDTSQVYDMFRLEARILEHVGNRVSATPLRGCGWVHPPSNGTPVASWETTAHASDFGQELNAGRAAAWRPALEIDDQTLLALLRQLGQSPDNTQHNMMLPLWVTLRITQDALRLLAGCQSDCLYYIDRKPEHVIWQGEQIRFLDGNGGDWTDTGGLDQAREDLLSFIGYVAYGLFTGRQLDGQPVQAIVRGTPHPSQVRPADGELLPFYQAISWVESHLQRILSRAFWSPETCYPSAAAMADELTAFEQDGRRKALGLNRRLETIVAQLQSAQDQVGEAEQQMRILLRGRLFTGPPEDLPIPYREALRLAEHLQRFSKTRVLPLQMIPGAGEVIQAPPQSRNHPPVATPARDPLPAEIPAIAKTLGAVDQQALAPTVHRLRTKVMEQRRSQADDLNWNAVSALLQCCCAMVDTLDQIIAQAGPGTPVAHAAARIAKDLRKQLLIELQMDDRLPGLPEITANWIRHGSFGYKALTEATILVAEIYRPRQNSLNVGDYRAQLGRLRAPEGLLTQLRTAIPPLSVSPAL